jgi:hypothetical protein
MKNEFLKSFTMLLLVVVLALAAAAVSANAQASHLVVADIPFEFSVGYKILPAGQYTVKALSADSRALLIQSADQNVSVLRLSDPIERAKDNSVARLVFHVYGQRYFLAEVWDGADKTGRLMLKSQEERTIEDELASLSPQSDAAKSTYETIEVVARLR